MHPSPGHDRPDVENDGARDARGSIFGFGQQGALDRMKPRGGSHPEPDTDFALVCEAITGTLE